MTNQILSGLMLMTVVLLSLSIINNSSHIAFGGGEMFPVDTSALLLAATYTTAAWMIPLLVTAIGFGVILTAQKTKLKKNFCPSCKLESDDIFKLGDKVVAKCDTPKCKVSLFFVE